MVPLCHYLSPRKVLLLSLILSLFTSAVLVCAYTEIQPQNSKFLASRKLLDSQIDDDYNPPPIKKKTTTISSLSPKTQTKSTSNSTKPTSNSTKFTSNSSKNQTKSSKSTMSVAESQSKVLKLPSDSTKNKTKFIKPNSESIKTQLKKLNSTSKLSNSAKPNSIQAKISSDLKKSSTPKNKTTKPPKTQLGKNLNELKSKTPDQNQKPKMPKTQKPNWTEDEEDDYDLVTEFRDLPTKFQETLLPDLEKISSTSKVYLNKANKEITKGFKPYVGKKYASTIASIVSFAFILIPLILVSLLFSKIKAYFTLQKLLIFIQIYLSIYFSILCISSLVTGIEPLRFFYAASQSTYSCIQVLQTLGYVLYLLLLLMYFVLVFSTDTGMGLKLLSLAQMVMGLAVGLHYYITVFHRMVLHQSPKTNWRIHGIYATCFLVICVLATAERRKKAYLEDGGEEGKKS